VKSKVEQAIASRSRDDHTWNPLLPPRSVRGPDFHFHKNRFLRSACFAKIDAQEVYAAVNETKLNQRCVLSDNGCCITDPHVQVGTHVSASG